MMATSAKTMPTIRIAYSSNSNQLYHIGHKNTKLFILGMTELYKFVWTAGTSRRLRLRN